MSRQIPSGGANGAERFDLTQITLEAVGGGYQGPAWIFAPHDSLHRPNPFLVEVLAPLVRVEQTTLYRLTLLRESSPMAAGVVL